MFIDESIFKNKSYGAYVLRKKYYQFTLISFVVGTAIMLLIFSVPLLIQFKHQMNIEHTQLRPTQIPMELLDIPPEILKQEKEQLPTQQHERSLQQDIPENKNNEEALTPDVSDSLKTTSTDTLANESGKKVADIEEGIFEYGSNLLNFRQWFIQNFQFPLDSKIRKTEGRAIAVFIVNENGYIDSVNIVSGIDPIIDSAIKNTLLNSPRWKPCIYNGKRVKQLYHFPVYLVRKI
ncbi:MAG: energy transducer TonB [Bacteroidales bacterium]